MVADTLSQHVNDILEFSIGYFLIWDMRSCICICGIHIPGVISTRRHDLNRKMSSSNVIRSYLRYDKSNKKVIVFLKHFIISFSLHVVHFTHMKKTLVSVAF